jgi:hypothetical protein
MEVIVPNLVVDTGSKHGIAPLSPPTHVGDGVRWPAILLLLVVALQVALIWSFPYPPTQDGGIHLQNGRLLLRLGDPGAIGPNAGFERRLAPSMGGEYVMAGLLRLWTPNDAERVLATILVVGFSLSAVTACAPFGASGALLLSPFALGYFFHLGFYSFSLSLIFFLLFLGEWLRTPNPSRARLAGWSLLVLVIAIAHPVTAVGAGALFLPARCWSAWKSSRGDHYQRVRSGAAAGLHSGLVLFPAILFVLWVRSLQELSTPVSWSLTKRLAVLFGFDAMSSFDPREAALAAAFAALILAGVGRAFWHRRSRPSHDVGLAAGLLALLVLYFISPNHFVAAGGFTSGGWITHRLSLLLVLATIVWLSRHEQGRSWWRILRIGATLIVLLQLSLHWSSWARIHGALAEIEVAHQLLPDTGTVLPVILNSRGAPGYPVSAKIAVLEHPFARLAADRDLVDLGNFASTSRGMTGFPVVYRTTIDPGVHLPRRGHYRLPDITAYESATGVRVDVVMVWGTHAESEYHPEIGPFLAELDSLGFRQQAVSPRGWLRMYSRR